MVRIVDITPDASVVKRIACRNCGALLEYVPADLHRRVGHDYSGGADGAEWIVCPNCTENVVVRSW